MKTFGLDNILCWCLHYKELSLYGIWDLPISKIYTINEDMNIKHTVDQKYLQSSLSYDKVHDWQLDWIVQNIPKLPLLWENFSNSTMMYKDWNENSIIAVIQNLILKD